LVVRDGVVARDRDVVQEEVADRRTTAPRPLARGAHAIPRPAAARADDERRPVEAEVLVVEMLADVLGRVRLRRLARGLPLLQQGAAAGAVVGRLRILEAALTAVDDAQAWGAAFPLRISVSRSTSTWSRTLRPPDCCRRATSSARRMSILPCRMRRW